RGPRRHAILSVVGEIPHDGHRVAARRVVNDVAELEIAERGPKLVGREQRHERISTTVATVLVRLAIEDRRDGHSIGLGDVELSPGLGARRRRLRPRRGRRCGLLRCGLLRCSLLRRILLGRALLRRRRFGMLLRFDVRARGIRRLLRRLFRGGEGVLRVGAVRQRDERERDDGGTHRNGHDVSHAAHRGTHRGTHHGAPGFAAVGPGGGPCATYVSIPKLASRNASSRFGRSSPVREVGLSERLIGATMRGSEPMFARNAPTLWYGPTTPILYLYV